MQRYGTQLLQVICDEFKGSKYIVCTSCFADHPRILDMPLYLTQYVFVGPEDQSNYILEIALQLLQKPESTTQLGVIAETREQGESMLISLRTEYSVLRSNLTSMFI